MEKNEKKYVTVGVGTPDERKVEIEKILQAEFVGGRVVTVAQLKDETLLFEVKNPSNSERAEISSIWLSKESAFAFFGGFQLFCNTNNINVKNELEKAIGKEKLEYSFQDYTKSK